MLYGHTITALAPSGDIFTGYATSSRKTLITEMNLLNSRYPATVMVKDVARYSLDLETSMQEFEHVCQRNTDVHPRELGDIYLALDEMLLLHEDSMAHLSDRHALGKSSSWQLTAGSDRVDGHYHACRGTVFYTFRNGNMNEQKTNSLLPLIDATVWMDDVQRISSPFLAVNPRVYLFSYHMEPLDRQEK